MKVTVLHKRLLLGVATTLLLGCIIFLVLSQDEVVVEPTPLVETPTPEIPSTTASTTPVEVIGKSVEGRAIEAYTFGQGETHLVFIGGIHGGYEWNSVLLSYALIDYLTENGDSIPDTLRVTVVPSANPDGVFKVIGREGRFSLEEVPTLVQKTGTGRFNANDVDLNRNFDCKWQPESTWRGNKVSAGTSTFSEPEALAIKNFVASNTPDAVIFYHSQSNAIYASECENGILPETRTLMDTYAKASGYPAVDTFDAYEVTGDAEGWLASINIPAITVELKTHETVEWERNLAGVQAIFTHYSEQIGL